VAIIADNLKENGSSRRLRGANNVDGKHFIVRADKKLSAFVELESAIRAIK
jgi:hypothetical protein